MLLDVQPLWYIREPFSVFSHLLGALLALGATVALVRRARRRGLGYWGVRRMVVYGLSLVAVFSASALFHLPDLPAKQLVLLKKVDQATIFIGIAGTSTAIYGAIRVDWTTHLTVATWVIAIGGLVAKMLIWPMPVWLTAVLYLSVSWLAASGLIALMGVMEAVHVRLLSIGGGVLTVGAFIFAAGWPVLWPGVMEGHELFHLFVLAGIGTHFAFIYEYCTHPNLFDLARAD